MPTKLHTTFTVEPKTLNELLALPVDQLKHVDIARMNLLCASGLPGSDLPGAGGGTSGEDVEALLARLDDWAKLTAEITARSLPDFHRRPHDFQNSEAKFRMLLIISVLQKEFGVHYQTNGLEVNYASAQHPLIVGMMKGEVGGNCASMPVLYVAVGRRLGYPVSLMLGKTHIFARWEDPLTGESFNIEGTNPRLNCHPDEYYRNWPYPITDREIAQGYYLKPLNAREELATFLSIRGHVLFENERYDQALHAFTVAQRLAPHDPLASTNIAAAKAALHDTRDQHQWLAYHRGRTGGRAASIAPPRPLIIDGQSYAGVDPAIARRMAIERRIIEQSQRRMQRQLHNAMPTTHPRPSQVTPPYSQGNQ